MGNLFVGVFSRRCLVNVTDNLSNKEGSDGGCLYLVVSVSDFVKAVWVRTPITMSFDVPKTQYNTAPVKDV